MLSAVVVRLLTFSVGSQVFGSPFLKVWVTESLVATTFLNHRAMVLDSLKGVNGTPGKRIDTGETEGTESKG